jgi:endogenous inhibitor of DNA gyrase (YacG/DUF329 family)
MVIQQPMDESLKKKCPECGKHKLYQDLSGQHTFVYQECKTLGHLASRNTERMGKYDLEARRQKDEERNKLKKRKPVWYNKEGKNLKKELADLNTPEKKHKYIMEGK